MPVAVVPTGLKSIKNPPEGGTRRRTTVTTGIYAPPDHDHVVSSFSSQDINILCVDMKNSDDELMTCHFDPCIGEQALALAMAYQSVTDHHKQRPAIDDLGPGDDIQR